MLNTLALSIHSRTDKPSDYDLLSHIDMQKMDRRALMKIHARIHDSGEPLNSTPVP